MSGTKPASELEGWIGLFIDSSKFRVLALISLAAYFIPVSATTTLGNRLPGRASS